MRAIIQRVKRSSVSFESVCRETGFGLVVLAAFNADDDSRSIDYVLNKIINLRIFTDSEGKMNLSVSDVGGEILFVPNFTVYADTAHGRRPSFSFSAPSAISEPLFDYACKKLKDLFPRSAFGKFGADMDVMIENDGPVTLIVESN